MVTSPVFASTAISSPAREGLPATTSGWPRLSSPGFGTAIPVPSSRRLIVTPVRSQPRCFTGTGTFPTRTEAPGRPEAVGNSGGTAGRAGAALDFGAAEAPATESDEPTGETGPDADPARWPDASDSSADALGALVAAAPHPVRHASVTPSTAAWILMTVGRSAWLVG